MKPEQKQKRSLPWGTIIPAALFSIVLVGGAVYFSGYDLSRFSQWTRWLSFSGGARGGTSIKESGRMHVLGRPDAPVTIVEYADFQCPLCAVFHFGAEAAMMDTYVKNGQARFVFKHYPFLGDESFTAAYASECAREQGKFWEYHDRLFEKQSQSDAENSGIFSRANLAAIAGEVGMQPALFESCLSSERYKDDVVHDLEEGKAAGVQGTPTIFINGEKMEGSLPFESYKNAIEKILRN